MEVSKTGFSNVDNTVFEGRKNKVKKEHPKKEKIKENAKRMALFLAGLATLGLATVAITTKNTNEQLPNDSKIVKNEDDSKNTAETITTEKIDTDDEVDKTDKDKKQKSGENIRSLPEYSKNEQKQLLPPFEFDTSKFNVSKSAERLSDEQVQVQPKMLPAPKELLALPPYVEKPEEEITPDDTLDYVQAEDEAQMTDDDSVSDNVQKTSHEAQIIDDDKVQDVAQKANIDKPTDEAQMTDDDSVSDNVQKTSHEAQIIDDDKVQDVAQKANIDKPTDEAQIIDDDTFELKLEDIDASRDKKAISDEEFQKSLEASFDKLMSKYREREDKDAAATQQRFEEQFAKVTSMLDDSIHRLDEGIMQSEVTFDNLKFPESGESHFVPVGDIDTIIFDMEFGNYGKNAQDVVNNHLDDVALRIFRRMDPETIAALPSHFIEMALAKDAMGNSDKGKLKRLQGMEDKFSPSGIRKITSTEEGNRRLLEYILGIEYVNPKTLSTLSLKDKITDMQKYAKAKKENLTWLMNASQE